MNKRLASVVKLAVTVSFVSLAWLAFAREGAASSPVIVDRSGKKLESLFEEQGGGQARGLGTPACASRSVEQPINERLPETWRFPRRPPQQKACYSHYIILELRYCCMGPGGPIFYAWGYSGGTEYCQGYQPAGTVCDGWCENEQLCTHWDC